MNAETTTDKAATPPPEGRMPAPPEAVAALHDWWKHESKRDAVLRDLGRLALLLLDAAHEDPALRDRSAAAMARIRAVNEDVLREVRALASSAPAEAHLRALLDMHNADSGALVAKYEETPYNPPDQPHIRGEKDAGHVQGPLHDYFESRGVPQPIRPDLEVAFDALVMARKEVAGRAPNAPIKPPLPELTPKQIQAVIRRGEKRPWSERREFGYKWTTNIFEFVQAEYGKWIPGLTQAHLKSADLDLWRFFTKRVSTDGLPEWLDVPSEPAAELRKITDPVERGKRIVAREVYREQSRASRAARRPNIKSPRRIDIAVNRR